MYYPSSKTVWEWERELRITQSKNFLLLTIPVKCVVWTICYNMSSLRTDEASPLRAFKSSLVYVGWSLAPSLLVGSLVKPVPFTCVRIVLGIVVMEGFILPEVVWL